MLPNFFARYDIPKLSHLKAVMREVFEKGTQNKEEEALKTAKEYTWSNSAKKLLFILETFKKA